MDTNFQPIISTNTRGHHHQHPLEIKRALVVLSLQPGASVARIAREHDVTPTKCSAGAVLMKHYATGRPSFIQPAIC